MKIREYQKNLRTGMIYCPVFSFPSWNKALAVPVKYFAKEDIRFYWTAQLAWFIYFVSNILSKVVDGFIPGP